MNGIKPKMQDYSPQPVFSSKLRKEPGEGDKQHPLRITSSRGKKIGTLQLSEEHKQPLLKRKDSFFKPPPPPEELKKKQQQQPAAI